MPKINVFSITYAQVTAWGAAASLLGLCISALFFADSLLLAATGLTAVALIFQMNTLLDENRDAIWVHRRSSWEANSVLVLKIIAIFFGVFLTSFLLQSLAPRIFLMPLTIKGEFFRNQPMPLFLHNLRVLTACLLLAFIYRSAGILLVICWNALNWSTALLSFIQSASETGARHTWFYALAVLPHLMIEAAAYVSAGLTGVFLSKAIFKYKLSSEKFFRVSRACVAILGVSVGCLWVAMELEIGLAQAVLAQLRR